MGKILEALALTRTEGSLPLRGLIETQVKHMVRGSTAVLITSSTSTEVALMVDSLLQRGLKPIVVIIDAFTFGGVAGSEKLVESIQVLGVPYRLVKNGMDLSDALSSGYARG